ncbi:low molecular weight phosphatase family protein [Marinobacter apostichopi]|uniref:arsenate-mycothiol transferase ArsC n=1 Tax=Marinobacter apostichopi TaxID=3035454 RepID=UPI0033656E62
MNGLVYERFGSRYGLLRFIGYWVLSQIGVYRRFPASRPKSNQRVVFVCSGNICRSPLAEVYAQSLGRDARSCGLDCTDGHPADPRARKFARSHGLDLENHMTVNVRNFEFQNDDLIVLMEPSHIAAFENKIGRGYPLALAGSYCERPVPYIHDPFNCNSKFFANCENKVMEAVRRICD